MKIIAEIRRNFSFMPERGGGVLTCDRCQTRWRVRGRKLGIAALRLFDHAAGHETCVSCGRERRACGDCSARGE